MTSEVSTAVSLPGGCMGANPITDDGYDQVGLAATTARAAAAECYVLVGSAASDPHA
jgi:hypothetical protein